MGDFTIFDDGYTRPGYLEEVEGLHDPLVFSYRLLSVLERDRLRLALQRAPEQEARLMAAVMARQVQSWNVVDASGKPAPVRADNLLRLPAACFDRLYAVVLGAAPSDRRPDALVDAAGGAEDLDEREDFLAELEAAASGRWVGDCQQERDRKNSSAG